MYTVQGTLYKAQGIEVTILIKNKSGDTAQPRSIVFLRKSLLGPVTGWGRNE